MDTNIKASSQTISVFGLGKVGSSMLAAFASKGYRVIGVDIEPSLVDKINKGLAPFIENNLQESISGYRDNIKATASYEEAVLNSDISFIIVPTPSDEDGKFSTEYIKKTVAGIGEVLKIKSAYHLVVVTSTVLPGACEKEIIPILEQSAGRKCGINFGFCYSPLFIALGNVISNILNPDMVLIGEFDKISGDTLEEFYRSFLANAQISRMNIVSAELSKISVNAYITTKITFANMLAEVCEKLPNSEIDVVTKAIGLDSRIGQKYLKAGLGYGGPCFPRDNIAFSSLAKGLGASAPLSLVTHETNLAQTDRIIQKILEIPDEITNVAILGLAYKPDTPVTEMSQGLELANKLSLLNKKVTVYDPMMDFMDKVSFNDKIIFADSMDSCVKNADAIIITLPYEEFKLMADGILEGRHPVIFDCWRILDPKKFVGKATYFATGVKEDELANFSNLRRMKVVVCGGGGFIGGHMVKDFIKRGYLNIRAVDIKPVNKWYQIFDEVENLELDLRDKQACLQALKDADIVCNFAADMGGMAFIEANRADCMLNVLINTHLLRAALENNVKRYFFASSACVYSTLKQDKPNIVGLKESDAYPAMPEDGYGWEKLFSERMCKNFSEDFGLQTRVARFHNIYGPLGYFQGGREKAPAAICRKVIEAKLTGSNKIEIWGNGEQTRSFTYIDDCTEGVYRILLSDIEVPINLGSSEQVSINQLVDLAEEFAGIKLERVYNLNAPRGVNGRNSDNTLTKTLLGWEPSIKLRDGLDETYHWIFDQIAPTHKKIKVDISLNNGIHKKRASRKLGKYLVAS